MYVSQISTMLQKTTQKKISSCIEETDFTRSSIEEPKGNNQAKQGSQKSEQGNESINSYEQEQKGDKGGGWKREAEQLLSEGVLSMVACSVQWR